MRISRFALILLACLLGTSRAEASFSLVQDTVTSCPASSANCTLTVTATGANHTGVIFGINNGTINTFLSTITQSGTCNVPWVLPVLSQWSGGSTTGAGSIAYCLSLAGGATSIPITWTTASPGFSGVPFLEYASTAAAVILDPGAVPVSTVASAFAQNSQLGVALTISGTNDLIIQGTLFNGVVVTSITTPYGNSLSFLGSGIAAVADSENTTNGSAPTWGASGSGAQRGNAIAFTEVASTTTSGIGGKAAIGGKAGTGD
jgi:hypothetical protein